MTCTLVGYGCRKPTMSPAEFRDYYENTHMPLLLSLTGSAFPTTHTRHYLIRTAKDLNSSDTTNANYTTTTFGEKPEDFEWDVYAELVFENREKLETFLIKLAEVTAAADGIFHADELAFLDLDKRKAVLVDDPVVTAKPSDTALDG